MYRPLLHYTASKNWISDPNGCIHVGGVFHLFYQHNPQSCGWGDIYWGHAVSEDLLHWKEQEIVLFPHPDTGLPFSGSAVLDKDNLSGLFPMNGSQDNIILIYTGHIPTSFSGTSAKEHQCIAYSLDAGSSFVPYRGNPVESSFIRSDFRDPKVFWYPQTNMWIMLVAANNTLEFYHSVNLIEWNLVSTFIPELNFSFKNLECPDIISVPLEENFDSKMWMITICIQYEQVANNQVASLYIIGDFDGHTFTQREPIRKVDYGSEFYAMQSWNNAPEGSCRWIGWVRDWLEDSFFINRIWRGVMSIPRELRLRKNQLGGHDLIQIPYLESIETQLTSTNFEGEIRLPLVSHQAYIIDINRVGMDCNGWCHFSLLGDEGDSLSIEYNDLYQHLIVEKNYTKIDDCKISHESTCADLNSDEFDLQIIIDAAVVEIFAGRGKISISHSWYTSIDGGHIEICLSPGNLKGTLREICNSSMVTLRGEHIGINQNQGGLR